MKHISIGTLFKHTPNLEFVPTKASPFLTAILSEARTMEQEGYDTDEILHFLRTELDNSFPEA